MQKTITKNRIVSVLQILAGVMFLNFAFTSDIQLGFGFVLFLQGVYNWA